MTQPIRSARLRLSQGQLFWREVGQGQTLVFLHGAWCDSNQWLPWMTQLSRHYHCVAPDLLGFGESERPQLHYSIELEVECLAEWLDALRLRQVCFVADSIGAWIAASYALRFPDQVKALVLLQPEGVLPQSNRWRIDRWLMLPPLYRLLQLVRPLARLLKQSDAIDRWLEQQQQMQQSPVACKLLFARRRAEIEAEKLRDRLPWLKLPILLLQDEQAIAPVKATNQAFASAAPSVQVQPCSSEGSQSVEAIDRFLRVR